MPRASFVCATVVVGGCLIAGHCLAGSQTFNWSGLGLDNNWSTAANWVGVETGPINDGTAIIAFGGRRRLTPTVDLPWSIGSISFSSSADLFTISGSPLAINSGGIINNSANLERINNAIVLGGGQTWNAAAGPLSFGGAINNNGNRLSIDGGFNTTIASTISSGGELIKNGSGTLTLGNGVGDFSANTFFGLTTVNGGTVTLNKAAGVLAIGGDLTANAGTISAVRSGQFSTGSNVTLSGGNINFGDSNTIGSFTALSGGYSATANTLNLSGTAPYALSVASGINLSHFNFTGSAGGGINLPIGGGASTTLGNIGLGGVNRSINVADGTAADDLVIGGLISGAGGIIKKGAGTLALSGSNTYGGGTGIESGSGRIATDAAPGTSASALGFTGGKLRTPC